MPWGGERMTIAVFDLTEHTQMSIRGTTGTHPDSKYVFGIHIGTDEVHAEQLGLTPDISAYEDMDWSKAVELAKWVNDIDASRPTKNTDIHLTDGCVISYMPPEYKGPDHTRLVVVIQAINLPKQPFTALYPAGLTDWCEWEHAVQMADWILEWDERLKEEKE
jgi:hypothetical protein